MSTFKPTIAFFGATGGCAFWCLVPALQAGYTCTALARTPSKLTTMLEAKGLDATTIASNLTITQGSIADPEAVKAVLSPPSGKAVDLIISGIGGKPVFQGSLRPTLDNPTICQDGVNAILAAARGAPKPPRLVVVSSPGISEKKRDYPFALSPLYSFVLQVPREDKKAMEASIFKEIERPVGERAIEGYTIVRPSLLTDKEEGDVNKLRIGVDGEPAVGYFVTRWAVGHWMFERLVKEWENGYLGKGVTITD